MSRLTRLVVLASAVLSVVAALASTAGAITWHNTGTESFTAGTGTAHTLSVTGVNLTCAGGDASGTSPIGTFVGTTFAAARLNAALTGCSLSGIPTAVSCSYVFTASSAPAGDVFTGNVDVLCSVTQFGAEVCKVEGVTSANLTNASTIFDGTLTFNHSSTLRTTNGVAASCPLGPGEPATLTTHKWDFDGQFGPSDGPRLTRTA